MRLLCATTRESALDDGDFSAFALAKEHGLTTPELDKLEAASYRNYAIDSRAQLEKLLGELLSLAERHAAARLRREQVSAKDVMARRAIEAQILAGDETVQKLEALLAVCCEALDGDGVLVSDYR